MIRAAIDVGSNSVLTTVSQFSDGHWTPVFESSEVTALGEGVKLTCLLAPESIERTLDAVQRGVEASTAHGAEQIYVAATMAARIAKNQNELIENSKARGIDLRVISGEDEAALGLLSVVEDPQFASYDRISVIDPGGHSTELTVAERSNGSWKTLFQRSFPIGTLAMLTGVFQDESPNFRARLLACSEIDEALGLGFRPEQTGMAITLGATGTNLVSIREKLASWEPEKVHGAWLDFEEISKAVAWLSDMSLVERARIVGMEPGREKTLHAGALILERFLHSVHVLGCFVSVRGWRHALVSHGWDGLPSRRIFESSAE